MLHTEFSLSDIQFEHQTWIAPDGKPVPFERADITELLLGEPSRDRWRDESMLQIEITRWPRKVTVHLIVTEGVDGYTGDGDGDGVIFEPVWTKKYTLATTDRFTLQNNFLSIMEAAYSKYLDLERKGLWV